MSRPGRASFKRIKEIVGLFGLFGKKDDKEDKDRKQKPADATGAVARRPDVSAKRPAPSPGATPPSREEVRAPSRSVERGQATTKKIDAIESEMSSEFTPTRPASAAAIGKTPAIIPVPSSTAQTAPARPAGAGGAKPTRRQQQLPVFEATLPSIGMSTEFLLGDASNTISIEVAASESTQAIEEAAILFANDQMELVGPVLRTAIDEDTLGDKAKMAWWMLFDFYQFTGTRAEFESLSLEYAAKFETSPPSWQNLTAPDGGSLTGTSQTAAPALPTVAFSGKLDGSIIKLLERVQKLGESHKALRLEFSKITDVDPIGCGLLLRILNKFQASEHELTLAGAHDLVARIRAILQVGRRDETEAPWLLLMEVLRLLNLQSEFEEASIDYCVTFEVSPPAFVAPRSKVKTDEESAPAPIETDSFVLPAVVDGRQPQLLSTMETFIREHDPAVIDCSRLNRMDFACAGQLLSMFAPLHATGKTIELQEVNHLVACLFDVVGLKDVARVQLRKL